MQLYYVYILKCSDGTFYTGVTSKLEKCLEEHQQGIHENSYTAKRLPVLLEFYTSFTEVSFAILFEKKVKKWSQAKKEALINSEFDKLPNLAKKRFK